MKQNLLDFVTAGKGLVVINSSKNAFTSWDKFTDLIGNRSGRTSKKTIGKGKVFNVTLKATPQTYKSPSSLKTLVSGLEYALSK